MDLATDDELRPRPYKTIEWKPQEDITTYELALATPLLISMAQVPHVHWEDYIPQKARRHFVVSD